MPIQVDAKSLWIWVGILFNHAPSSQSARRLHYAPRPEASARSSVPMVKFFRAYVTVTVASAAPSPHVSTEAVAKIIALLTFIPLSITIPPYTVPSSTLHPPTTLSLYHAVELSWSDFLNIKRGSGYILILLKNTVSEINCLWQFSCILPN